MPASLASATTTDAARRPQSRLAARGTRHAARGTRHAARGTRKSLRHPEHQVPASETSAPRVGASALCTVNTRPEFPTVVAPNEDRLAFRGRVGACWRPWKRRMRSATGSSRLMPFVGPV
ncbi:hypothetical protein E3T38_13820 [Cryobacterium sp. Hb1]|nr:hypothetical protein E3T38_13820 [Cryobacterium sp. Hb1]